MAFSKIMINGTPLIDLTQDTVAVDNLLSSYTAHDASGTAITGTATGGGGGSVSFTQDANGYIILDDSGEGGGGSSSSEGWQRPAQWPDYSKLKLVQNNIEAEFFTYDNRRAADGIQEKGGVRIKTDVGSSTVYFDRVQIGSDGTVTVLESDYMTTNGLGNHNGYQFSIPTTAGDYVCYRLAPATGAHITQIGLWNNGTTFAYNQPCVERYGNLPYCTDYYNFGSSYNGWGCTNLISDTILAMPSTVERIEYNQSFKLKNLPTQGWTHVIPTSAGGVSFNYCLSLKQLPVDKIDTKAVVTGAGNLFANTAVEYLDCSNISLESATNINYFADGNYYLKRFRAPKNMTGYTTNFSYFIRNCRCLEVAQFDATFDSSGAGIGSSWFSGDLNLKAIILRSTTLVALTNTNAVSDVLKAGLANVYVPSAIVDTYKEASNWSTYANFILPIEGSYWQTHHADDSLIS